MRDLRKLRTKYEIKLDNRHIAYLLIGQVVLAALVFGLGVTVGKGLGQLDAAAEKTAAGPVAAADKAPTPPPPPVDSLLRDEAAPPAAPLAEAPPPLTPTPAPMATPTPTQADLAPALPANAPGAQVDVASLPAPPKQGDYWTVQVGAYPTKEEAVATFNRVKGSGNQPTMEQADLGERGVWWRVSLGQYATEAGARAMAQALREREKMDTWVRYVP